MFKERFGTAGLTVKKRITVPAVSPLSDLPSGTPGVVARLDGGPGFRVRMVALGFATGAELNVVRNTGRGPLIVALLGSQIALGRGEAGKVLVARAAHGSG